MPSGPTNFKPEKAGTAVTNRNMDSEEPAAEPTEEVCTRVLRTKHKRKCKAERKYSLYNKCTSV